MASSREELTALVSLLKQVDKQLVLIGEKDKKALKSIGDPKTLKDIKKTEKALQDLNKTNKELGKTRKKITELSKAERQARIEQQEAIKRETRELRINAQIKQSEAGSLNRLRAQLIKTKIQWDKLSKSERENTRAGKNAFNNLQKLDAQVRRLEKSTGRAQRNVGNYSSALSGVGGALRTVAGALGITAGLAGLVRVFSNGIKTFQEFESGSTRVAAILGQTSKETIELQKNALQLGATTAKSATEVTKLQEAYARLGFKQQDIINLTEPTINGSIALNAALEETANLTGAVVNTFDEFGTADAPLILDQLTVATQNSALNFEKLNTAIPIAAGAAAGAGVSFQTFVAQLGQAADRGIDASTSATSLRNIYLELSKKGLTLEKALAKINGSQDKLSAANELFGKRAAVTALALANTTEETAKLETALDNAGGAAERTATQQLDTLEGSVTLLSSAWEGFVLSILTGDGVISTFLRETVEGISRLISSFTDLGDEQEDLIDSNIELAKSTSESIEKNQGLVDSYETLTDKENLNKEERIELDRVTNELIVTFGESVAVIDKETGALSINIEAVKKKILADKVLNSEAAKDLFVKKQQLEIQIETAKQSATNLEELKKSFSGFSEVNSLVTRAINAAQKGGLELSKVLAENSLQFLQSGRSSEEYDNAIGAILPTLNRYSSATLNLNKNQADLAKVDAALLDLGIDLNELAEDSVDITDKQTEAIKKKNKGLTDEQKAFNKQLQNQIELLKLQEQEALLLTASEGDKINIREETARKIFELEQKTIGLTNEQRIINEKELSNELLQIDIDRIDNQIELEEKRVEEIEKVLQKEVDAANKLTQFRLNQASEDEENIDKRVDAEIRAAEFRFGVLLNNDKLLADERLLIEEQFQDEKTKIEENGEKDRDKLRKEQLAKEAELTKAALTIVEASFKKRGKARQEALDEELDGLEKQESKLEDLAAEGNETAVKSLALAQKREAEIRREQERELQRQKRIEAGLTAFKVFAAKTEAGDKNALGSTIRDITVLQGFINALPSALEGTIDTGKGGNVDGKGGMLYKVHPNERIVPKDDNMKMAGMSNKELGNIADLYNKGLLTEGAGVSIDAGRFQSNEQLIGKFDELTREIKNLPKGMPVSTGFYDPFRKALGEVVKRGNKITKTTQSIFD